MSDFRELVLRRVEAEEPQRTILKFFQDNDGKRITQHHVEKLRQLTGRADLRLSKRYGMTNLEWKDGENTRSLILAWSEVNVIMDAVLLEEKNAGYFSALDERNVKRNQVLSDSCLIDAVDMAVERYRRLRAEAAKARKELEGLVERLPEDSAVFNELLGESHCVKCGTGHVCHT
jgi:hypothetical protein